MNQYLSNSCFRDPYQIDCITIETICKILIVFLKLNYGSFVQNLISVEIKQHNLTNGNVHPLKNRMKVNIFSFYAASAQLILIQLAMSTRTKFEIRHRIYLQSNSSLYLTRCIASKSQYICNLSNDHILFGMLLPSRKV